KSRRAPNIPEPILGAIRRKCAIRRLPHRGMFHAEPHGISRGAEGTMLGRLVKDAARKPAKRMLATGRKINGTWQVKTFLRAANDTREAFWQTPPPRGR